MESSRLTKEQVITDPKYMQSSLQIKQDEIVDSPTDTKVKVKYCSLIRQKVISPVGS